LTLEELRNLKDTTHDRIYDCLTEMCFPCLYYRKEFQKSQSTSENRTPPFLQ